MLQDAIDPAALKRVLVIKLRHHGDVLLTSPVFTTLKRCAPQAELDALVYADTAPMLRGHPALSQLFTIDRHWKRAGRFVQRARQLQPVAAFAIRLQGRGEGVAGQGAVHRHHPA